MSLRPNFKAVLEQAEPSLRQALTNKELSAVARNRIERILEGTDGFVRSAKSPAQVRGVEVLEGIGNAQARELLAELAAGGPTIGSRRKPMGPERLERNSRGIGSSSSCDSRLISVPAGWIGVCDFG